MVPYHKPISYQTVKEKVRNDENQIAYKKNCTLLGAYKHINRLGDSGKLASKNPNYEGLTVRCYEGVTTA